MSTCAISLVVPSCACFWQSEWITTESPSVLLSHSFSLTVSLSLSLSLLSLFFFLPPYPVCKILISFSSLSLSSFSLPVWRDNHLPFQQKSVPYLPPFGLPLSSLSPSSAFISLWEDNHLAFQHRPTLSNDCFQWGRTVKKLCPTHTGAFQLLRGSG